MLRHNSFTIYLKYVATDFRVVATAFFKTFFKSCSDRKHYGRDLEALSSLELCLSFVATFSCWLRHISFCLLKFCVATYKNCVVTRTAAFSTFLLLFRFFSLCFQLTPKKQKVGEYSIIGHTNRPKIVKNMLEKWIKNR